MITRRQHYVWQKYLKAWSNKKSQIWWLRAGIILKSNTLNVALEKDFYKLKQLSEQEIKYLEILVSKIKNDILRDRNLKLIAKLSNISKVASCKMLTQIEENFHSRIESDSSKYIESLLDRNIDFCSIENDYDSFLYFLCIQYFRTKNLRDSIFQAFEEVPIPGVDISNCWPIMRRIFSTNLAFSLSKPESTHRFTLLVNESDIPFIAGDQPVINLRAVHLKGKVEPTEIDLFYPVSPSIAVLITDDEIFKTEREIFNVEKKQAAFFNKMLFDSSHEQIFASTEDQLRSFI